MRLTRRNLPPVPRSRSAKGQPPGLFAGSQRRASPNTRQSGPETAAERVPIAEPASGSALAKTKTPESAQAPSDIADKRSPTGRLQRFCLGRWRMLPLRLAYECTGAMVFGLFQGGWAGALILAIWLTGEAVDMTVNRWVMRRGQIVTRTAGADDAIAMASAFWALCMASGAAVIWSTGGMEYWMLALTFLVSASVNAELVGGLHPRSLRIVQIIFVTVGGGLMVVSVTASGPTSPQALFSTAAAILAATLSGLFLRLRFQNKRRHEFEQWLLASRRETEAANHALVVSQDELKARNRVARLKAAEAEKATRAKSDFLAHMSHELRTPLNGILGIAELLENADPTADQAQLIDTLSRSGRSLLSIINDTLDLSQVEAGKFRLASAPFCPCGLIEDVTNLIRPLAEQRGLSFTLEGALPRCMLLGDVGRLRQVMLNLLGNAVKFTAHGGVVLNLSHRIERGRLMLKVAVKDTGPGIAPKDADRIFAAFEQGDGHFTRRFDGSGLGLAISRQLAELMDGTLALAPNPGGGCIFTLQVPLALHLPEGPDVPQNAPAGGRPVATGAEARPRADGDAPRRPRPHDAEPQPNQSCIVAGTVLRDRPSRPKAAGAQDLPDLNGVRVLLAEDNRTNRMIFERFLHGTDADLCLTPDGAQAVEIFGKVRPDVVLMDISMPVMSGFDAAREIRRVEASLGLDRCPIIALTAHAFTKDHERCRAAGMDAVLLKPLSRKQFLSAIVGALAKDDPSGTLSEAAQAGAV